MEERERTCKNGAAMQSGVVEDTFVVVFNYVLK